MEFIVGLLSLAIPVLMIVEAWRILQKQGQPGWRCLIPIYGEYCIYAASGAGDLFWKQILGVYGGGFLSGISNALIGPQDELAILVIVLSILSLGLSIYGLRCMIRMQKALARSFGKSAGFGWGLILLGIVFRGILAFSGDAVFRGASGTRKPQSRPQPAPQPRLDPVPDSGGPTAFPSRDFSQTVSVASPDVSPLASTAALPPEQMQHFLRCQKGVCAGSSFLIRGSVTAGRAPGCDILISDPRVSGNHCRFFWREDKLFVMDLGSTNGTSVEGFGKIPANVPVELREGDTITLGLDNVFTLV